MDRLFQLSDESKKEKIIRSAFDSQSFEKDGAMHVDQDVGSATISPSGRDIALASKSGLHIIDLDSLNSPRHLPYLVQWKIVDVQWSPFSARDYWIVSTANQKALVWNLMMPEEKNAVELTLHAHSRAITDINFSAHHPDILSTCAVDGYVHCWDLRRPRAPVMSFVDWYAGATQVKYNRQDPHILASSHDGWLRIWDDRNGAYPLRSIEAHESKIYGIDWNRTRSTHIVTCSLDKSIRFWDYSKTEDVAERIIRTDFPVWRARHTPFGSGLLAMPQTSPGTLHLYNRRLMEGEPTDSAAPPVEIFPGHGPSKVKEFLWRSRGDITEDRIDHREFQLVSWGEDKNLRLQCLDADTFARVGYIRGAPVDKNVNFTRKGAVYRTFRSIDRAASDKDGASICMPHPRDIPPRIVSGVLSTGVKKKIQTSQHPRDSSAGNGMGSLRDFGLIGQHSIIFGDKRKSTSEGRGQIGWMSGIKLSKKPATNSGETRPYRRRYSLINGEFEDDEEWDAPENLHDEIVRVHDQYSKVNFEEVDMDKRIVVASMNGPWGEHKTNVYLKVYIDFPNEYPNNKAAHFTIGKTSSIAQEVWEKLTADINHISENFLARKQGCLETAFSYLIGDLDLDESTRWFDQVPGEDMDDMSDSSSEGEDDEIAPGASAMMSQELDPASSGADMLGPNQNAPPPPRLCGAVFSTNGSLVCFFPPKTDKTKSLLGTLNDTRDRSKGVHVFESFGRLNTNASPEPRRKLRSLDKYNYDSSDESESSSSSDSDSTQYRGSVFPFRRAINRNYSRALSTNQSQRSGSATGTGTAVGTVASKGRSGKTTATISIHDVRDLIPAKQELAAEYLIFGDGRAVCEHNAAVAEKHGYQDLADIWKYASTLLESNIPLEVLDRTRQREPILIIAKSIAKQSRRTSDGSDSGVDLSADKSCDDCGLSARVKWGYHPLARQLIADLFKYFIRLADTQMLGMLSCVFSEPASNDSSSLADTQVYSAQTPLAMKTPAFSLDYFPSDEVVWTSDDAGHLAPPMHKASLTPVVPYGSLESNNVWHGHSASTSYSTGDTPPLQSGKSSGEKHRPTQSLSTSPDDARLYRRAQTFAASFSRPFGMTASSSPPNRKKSSPAESVVNSLVPAVTWGHTTILGSVKEHLSGSKSPYPEEELPRPVVRELSCTGIRVTMRNQNVFDDEGCMSTSLLEVNRAGQYRNYRTAYASLLYSWGHPLASLEILKFNGLPSYFESHETIIMKSMATSVRSNNSNNTVMQEAPPSPILLGRQETYLFSADKAGLDVAGYCLKHDIRLDPLSGSLAGGAIGRCERCKSVQRQLQCVVCNEPISTRYTACLSCGCVAHEQCQEAYHASGDEECAGGCDCICTEAADRGIVEGWEVMMGAIEMMRLKDGMGSLADESVTVGQASTDEDWSEDEDWKVSERGSLEQIRLPHSPAAGSTSFDSATSGPPQMGNTPSSVRGSPGAAMSNSPGIGRGYTATLGKRLEAVKTGDWSTKLRKKASSLRKESSL